MPFVSVNDANVHYEIDGSGPGLVLVHGVGGDAELVFGAVAPQFTSTHTVIRPNLSGSGQTTDDGAELTIDGLAAQVAAATRAGVSGPVDLLGFSLGATVAATVAATYPELVRRLILLGGWAHNTGPRDKFYFETLAKLYDHDRELFKRVGTLTGFSPAAVAGMGHDGLAASLVNEWPPPGVDRQIDVSLRMDIRPLLPKITVPTLIIGLGQDQMVPVEGSRQLAAGISGSRLVELPADGHLDWMGQPDEIVKYAREFFA